MKRGVGGRRFFGSSRANSFLEPMLGAALLAAPAIGICGIDQPWLDPAEGVGTLPRTAAWSGAAGACLLALRAVLDHERASQVMLAAYYGAVLGLVVGLPLSCAVK